MKSFTYSTNFVFRLCFSYNHIFLLCSLYLHHVEASSKYARYHIDEFIKELMASDKFNDLADKIATRAALKIKIADNSDAKYTLRHKTKPLSPRDVMFGKNNSKVYLKRDDSKLYLNYRHLTNELDHTDKITVNPFSSDPDHGPDDTHKNKINDLKPGKVKKHTNKKHKQTGKHHSKHTTKSAEANDKLVRAQKEHEIDNSNISDNTETRVTANDNNDEVNLSPNNTYDASLLESKEINGTDSNEDYQEKSVHSSSKHETRIRNRAVSNDSESSVHSDELAVPRLAKTFVRPNVEKTSFNRSSATKKLRKSVRRENGKLYTYLSSPDYKEYHEKLNKLGAEDYFS